MAERKVRAAGFDPARLPPGQYLTEKWPVLHAGSVPRTDLSTWTFRVYGEVEQARELTWEEFNALPRSSTVQDIHCVTRWSRFDAQFEGVHWREIAKLCLPKPSARFAIEQAEQEFTTNVPLSFLEDENALLTFRLLQKISTSCCARTTRFQASCARSMASSFVPHLAAISCARRQFCRPGAIFTALIRSGSQAPLRCRTVRCRRSG